MEIHNHGNNLKTHFSASNQAKSNAASQASTENEVGQTGASNPTRLLEQLKSGEAVRKQLVVEIQAKIHAGEYMTRAAAENAASQIVGY